VLPQSTEHQDQSALIEWCQLNRVTRRIFAVPNGGGRSKAEAGRLKAEGVRRGVPDLMLPVAAGGAHGLFLEMKAHSGRLSKEQDEELDALAREGYVSAAAWGLDAGIEVVSRYIAGRLTPGRYEFKSDPPAKR
jgi:hypothetical protein